MRQLIIALLFLPMLAAAQGGTAKPPEPLVDYRDGTYYAVLSLVVPVAPQLALEVLTDFEHMADFVPNLKSSRVLAHSGNIFRIAQQGRANFGPLGFPFESQREIEVFPDGRLVSHILSGSPRYLRSELRISAEPAGSRLDYQVEMIPDRWLPAALGLPFIRHELAEQFVALGQEMERRRRNGAPVRALSP